MSQNRHSCHIMSSDIWYGIKFPYIFKNAKATHKLGQMVSIIHYSPQILPLWTGTGTEISNVEWKPFTKWCPHITNGEKRVTDGKRTEIKWTVSRKERGKKSIASKERIYLNHSGPFPIVFFLLPPSTPLFSLPVLYSSSGAVFPPLLSFYPCLFLPLWCPSVSLWLVVWV